MSTRGTLRTLTNVWTYTHWYLRKEILFSGTDRSRSLSENSDSPLGKELFVLAVRLIVPLTHSAPNVNPKRSGLELVRNETLQESVDVASGLFVDGKLRESETYYRVTNLLLESTNPTEGESTHFFYYSLLSTKILPFLRLNLTVSVEKVL